MQFYVSTFNLYYLHWSWYVRIDKWLVFQSHMSSIRSPIVYTVYCDDVTGSLPSVPSLPLPPWRGRKVMMAPFIIISSVNICLAASSGAYISTHSNTHTHCQTYTHFISTRTCRQNRFTYSEKSAAARPDPSIIHAP